MFAGILFCNQLTFVVLCFCFSIFSSGAKSLVSVSMLRWFELLCTYGIISHESF